MGPIKPTLAAAYWALLALTPEDRGLVMCWFCLQCYKYTSALGSPVYTQILSVISVDAKKLIHLLCPSRDQN